MNELKTKLTATLFIVAVCILYGSSSPFAQNLDSHSVKTIKNPLIEEAGMSAPHILVVNDTCYVFTGPDISFRISD